MTVFSSAEEEATNKEMDVHLARIGKLEGERTYTGQRKNDEVAPRRSRGISSVWLYIYGVRWSPVEPFTDQQLRLGSRLHSAGSTVIIGELARIRELAQP